ncbi:hypothetical protein ACM39_13590 [Chryseobacterium sp. FH2]|uniref:hypothetical protein n=1 Tax=Chryseobacterium sp. FH2 TaxID=1674291 RepID=UPI00065A993D|nr:hypothetical protein [Chryseobacterium sp. FH2]KMQ67465.1 hypothetical protein ACM39_13590 [Chryseobacterium sp. FH2]
MKNLILATAILVAGMTSAKTITIKSSNSNIQKSSKQVKLKSKKVKSTFVTYTSCGVAATTTQDWTQEQGQIWANMVEANYCGNGY